MSNFGGVLCKKSADQTTADYSTETMLTWNTNIYDTHNFHDTGSNTEQIVVPGQINNMYVRARVRLHLTSVTVAGSDNLHVVIKKNGVIVGGSAVATNGAGAENTTQTFLHATTPPILAATNDVFIAYLYSSDNSITVVAASSTFGLQVLCNQTTKGCIAILSANKTTQNYSTATILAWDGTDTFDPDGCHDPVTANTKIIIPSAYNGRYGYVTATINASSVGVASVASLCVLRNGVTTWDGFAGDHNYNSGYTVYYRTASTQPHVLTTSDYYEARMYSSDTSITLLAAQSSLSLWIVDT